MVQLGSGAQSAREEKLLEKNTKKYSHGAHYDPYMMTFNALIL